jgi:hypothetical protein
MLGRKPNTKGRGRRVLMRLKEVTMRKQIMKRVRVLDLVCGENDGRGEQLQGIALRRRWMRS